MIHRSSRAKRLWAGLFLAVILLAQGLAAAHRHAFEAEAPEAPSVEEAPPASDECGCDGHSVPKPDIPVQDGDCSGRQDGCSGHHDNCDHASGVHFCQCVCHARGLEQPATAPAARPAPRQPVIALAEDFAPEGERPGVFHPPKTLS